MKTEKQLVLEFFNATEIDEFGVKALVNNRWEFITDLTIKYRQNQKTKKTAKIRQQKITAEFNLIRDELVSEVENYCIDLFKEYDDVVVFINRTSVNVFDPVTQTTLYTLLSPNSHCISVRSAKIDNEKICELAKSLNFSLSKNQLDECLINKMKETREVAETIFEMVTKLRYE